MKKIIISLTLVIIILLCSMPLSATEYIISDEGRIPFEDIKADSWYEEGAIFCYANGVINGMNDYTFAPGGSLTRAQFVTMLANMEGTDTSVYKVTKFTDVKKNHWYYGAIAWAYENGIVSGTSVDKFSPNLQINRQTLARMMTLYMKSKRYDVTVLDTVLDKYTDNAKIDTWGVDGIKYIVSAGILTGMTESTIGPKDTVTRAQAARILMIFMQNYYYGLCEHEYREATCTDAATCTACGMVDGLPKGHIMTGNYSCKTGGMCEVCNETIQPSNILHDFLPATCEEPETCRICDKKRGEYLGHTTSDGICERCGVEIFYSYYRRIEYYITAFGKYDPDSDSYYVGIGHADSVTRLVYYNKERRIVIENVYYADNGDLFVTEIFPAQYYDEHDMLYTQISKDEYVFIGEGKISGAYTKDTIEKFDIFWCIDSTYDRAPGLNIALNEMMEDSNSILDSLYGGSVSDFGFVAYNYKIEFPEI